MSYFGTDGIRGKFGKFPITPDFILKLGFVTGQVLCEQNDNPQHPPSVVIGKDTRNSSYIVEAALQAGINAAGVDVYLLGVLPTPAIAHIAHSFSANAGVVISASHNPFYDNGIKLFSGDGKKISDQMQEAINTKLDDILANHDNAPIVIHDPSKLGKSYRINDAKGRYIEFCKGSLPYHYNLSHLTIVIDCANGAGYSVGPRVFTELGATVIAIHDHPNGTNINDNCGSTHPDSLQQAVIDNNADAGIAIDGDGDRIIMVDENGHLIDGDSILYILATQSTEQPKGVVGTQMSNMALELALNRADIGFDRAKVGDRYVMQGLQRNEWILGGEPSGHILCLDKSRTGDALVAGLQVLAVMAQTGKSLSELTQGFALFPQVLVNVRLEKMADPYDYPELVKAFDKVETMLDGSGRLLVRRSGTEPVIRVMVECQDAEQCNALADELAQEVARVMQA